MDEDNVSETPSGTYQTTGSTGSTPRPESVPSAPEMKSGQSSSAPSTTGTTVSTNNASKRRRGLGVVTPNACTECRKKRAKCDGQRPCGRCKQQKDVECVYEVPVRQSKENLRTEIESLRHRQRSSDQVFAALVRPELWEEVMQRLRGGQSIENISDWVGAVPPQVPGAGIGLQPFAQHARDSSMGAGTGMGSVAGLGAAAGGTGGAPPGNLGSLNLGANTMSPVPGHQQIGAGDISRGSPWRFSSHSQSSSAKSSSHPEPMNWAPDLSGPPQSRVGVWADSMDSDQRADGMQRTWGLKQVLPSLKEPGMKSPASTWTTITSDVNLVQHLLGLYFCWEYPTFASLSKEHFLQDFQDGRHRYCSPILINALLALGCRFSTQPETRANPDDPYTSGDHFFKESLRLFYQESDHHSLTTIQALGIMSIREASCGRDSESWFYAGQSIRLAIEMGLHRVHDEGDEDEIAVQSATFWGAFALDHAWSLATGSLPQCSCFPHLPPKPAIITDIEASLWIPYTDDARNLPGAPLQRSCEQPSNVRSVYKCFCELSELVHQSLYVLHSPGKHLTARDLLGLYTQYLNWYDQIPEVLRLGHNFTPAVLFAHLYYHFAILLLFRPLIKLRIIGSKVAPRDVCSQAADAIQGLLRSYSQLYTLSRTPSFVPYFVLTSSIMHLAIGAASASADPRTSTPKDIERAVKLDSHIVESIRQGIVDLTEMAPCHHFAEQALNILRYLAQKWNIDVGDDVEEKAPREHIEHLVKPSTSSLNFFAPNIRAEDFNCAWGTGGPASGPGKQASTQKMGDDMENPLFWPFPMQGRPILPTGGDLEKAGFATI